MLTPPVTPPPGNLIVAWNNIYLDTVRHIGGAPGPLARIGALLHLAMYEATNRLVPNSPYPSILKDVKIPVPPGATAKLSTAYAASFTLQAAVETYVTSTLAAQGGISNPFDPFQLRPGAMAHMAVLQGHGSKKEGGKKASADAEAASKTFGEAVATAVFKAFPDFTGLDPTLDPEPKNQTGEWRDTGSGPALTPRWGTVPLYLVAAPTTHYLPTVLGSLSTYTNLLHSPVYAAQVAETKLLGAAHTTARTAEETEIAFFWANDVNSTSKPPGQLYTIVQTVAKQQGTLADKGDGKGANSGQLQTARLFAMVGTAMVNASIVAWQAKYYWPTTEAPVRLWRPETAIHFATQDGNPSTAADPAWQPLSAMTSGQRFSPNFPAFVSGHSTFGAAFAAAMQAFYGTDAIPFTATTEDPHAVKDENGIRRTRSFTSFTQAALENGRSRVYLGVHYQFDANGGFEIGTAVGKDTAKAFAQKTRKASEIYEARKEGETARFPFITASLQLASAAKPTVKSPNKTFFLDLDKGDVYLLFSVDTEGEWYSMMLPLVPKKLITMGKQRIAHLGSVAELQDTDQAWILLIVNTLPTKSLPYRGSVRIVQASSEAEAAIEEPPYDFEFDDTLGPTDPNNPVPPLIGSISFRQLATPLPVV